MIRRLFNLSILAATAAFAMAPAHAETRLMVNVFVPPSHFMHKVLRDWASDVEKATANNVKFDFAAGSLAPPPQQLQGVSSGIFDVAFSINPVIKSKAPLLEMSSLPWLVNDPEAARYVWGTAFHWYVGDEYENPGRVHDAFPDKAIFFSEGCCDSYHEETINEWKWGEVYARSMINDFNNWTCGWTDWNVLLDERGGPNHVGNFCFAPIHADTRSGKITYMNSYYYIGHFSKFVRPGARRIACTVSKDELMATAFLNSDGKVATVVMNASEKPLEVKVWVGGKAVPASLPAHSIATVVWR